MQNENWLSTMSNVDLISALCGAMLMTVESERNFNSPKLSTVWKDIFDIRDELLIRMMEGYKDEN